MKIGKKKVLTLFALTLMIVSLLLVNTRAQRLYWKPSYPEYAPSGMPDFNQRQDNWKNPVTGQWTWCAPTAVANSLWWLDSEFHPSNLVTTYLGAISEHDPSNVMPLILNLAWWMDTDGIRTGTAHVGTWTVDIQAGINQYLIQQGVSGQFYVKLENFPNFTYVEQEVERCEDVVLVLGFWMYTGSTWYRPTQEYELGSGHCVTVAGINSTTLQIAISDPDNDAFEAGLTPGRSPVPHTYPHGPGLHNNASLVSQDIYNATLVLPVQPPQIPVGTWALQNYTVTGAPPGTIAVVEAAVITSPMPHPQLYWKPSYPEYAPSGMPDFNQRQDAWNMTGQWTWCAPTAVANSLWWLDSEFHPSNLVTTYLGAISEHDPSNVMPLIQDLAWWMDTDGIRTGTAHVGTWTVDIQAGINQYLIQQGVSGQFYVKLENFPNFTYVEQEVERCEDVVLVLGFWVWTGQYWYREYYPYEEGSGHCVTVAGINSTTLQIAISDPDNDAFEAGLTPGRSPVPHPYPHNSSIHNNASLVSHDIYNVALVPPPPGLPVGTWALQGYTNPIAPQGAIAVVEAAVITSPLVVQVCGVNITNVVPSKTEAYPKCTINVTVTVHNNGTIPINCTVNAYYYNVTVTQQIGTSQNITNLAPCNSINVTFTWNLWNDWVSWKINDNATYTIKANATCPCGASDEFINGNVKIRLLCDVDGSGTFTSTDVTINNGLLTKIMLQIITMEQALAQYPFADVDCDGKLISTDITYQNSILTKLMLQIPLR